MTGAISTAGRQAKYPDQWYILALISMVIVGCGGGGDGSSSNPPPNEPQVTADTDAVLMAVTALQEPRITVNLLWSSSETDFENISSDVTYKEHPYTTWKNDYDEKLAKCQSFGGAEVGGKKICVPENDTTLSCTASSMLEYGYFCGGGRPGGEFLVNEPLDGIDYCCYLHDRSIWAPPAQQSKNACGMAMCVRKMTEYPAGATSLFPKVEGYRQCIYDWATTGCLGNQSNDPLAPIVGINP